MAVGDTQERLYVVVDKEVGIFLLRYDGKTKMPTLSLVSNSDIGDPAQFDTKVSDGIGLVLDALTAANAQNAQDGKDLYSKNAIPALHKNAVAAFAMTHDSNLYNSAARKIKYFDGKFKFDVDVLFEISGVAIGDNP
jgi:hypothetical protein